jgi:hypothetical protein
MTLPQFNFFAGLTTLVLLSAIFLRVFIGARAEANRAMPRTTITITWLQAFRALRCYKAYSVWDAFWYATWLSERPLAIAWLVKHARKMAILAMRG